MVVRRPRGRSGAAPPCRVSVVVPVYNTGEHLHDLVRSLERQTMPQQRFEVIWVDDESTDGTGVLLDRLASEHPTWVVQHIPHAGWPGTPRNVGLDLARGEYVAFVDHDDYLASDGLQAVCDFADRHHSDVVVAREVGVGRSIGRHVFRSTVPDARLDHDPLLGLLTPHKVYRRSMLQENGIRFPDGKARLEDHLFNVRAYFAARRISLYSDRPYYYWTRRPGHTHASSELKDPHEYVEVAIGSVLDVVEANTEPGPRRNRIAAHWLEKKLLPLLAGPPMVGYPPEYREALFTAVRGLVLDRYPQEVDRLLPLSSRVRLHLLRAGRLDDMVALAGVERQVTTSMGCDGVSWDGRYAVVHLVIDLVHRDGAPVELDCRDGRLRWSPRQPLGDDPLPDSVLDATDELRDPLVLLLAQRRGEPEDAVVEPEGRVHVLPIGGGRARLVYRGVARVPLDQLLRLGPGDGAFVIDVDVEMRLLGWRSQRRVRAPEHLVAPLPREGDPRRAAFYTTNMGNLSLRVERAMARGAERPPAAQSRTRALVPQRLRPRRVARALRRRLAG